MDLIVMSEAASYYFAKRTAGTGRGVDRQLVAKENPFQVFADIVLMAAIRRLRLPYDSVSRTISVAQTITMSRAELKTEKANIKWEFILYDQLFVKKFGRRPSRTGEEALIPLSQYYRHVCECLSSLKLIPGR